MALRSDFLGFPTWPSSGPAGARLIRHLLVENDIVMNGTEISADRRSDFPATERQRPFRPHLTAAGENERGAAIAAIHSGTCRAEPAVPSSRSIARRALLISAVAAAAEYVLPRFTRAAASVVLPSGLPIGDSRCSTRAIGSAPIRCCHPWRMG